MGIIRARKETGNLQIDFYYYLLFHEEEFFAHHIENQYCVPGIFQPLF